jgi:hypothetical protein
LLLVALQAMLALASFVSRLQDVGVTPEAYLKLAEEGLPHCE